MRFSIVGSCALVLALLATTACSGKLASGGADDGGSGAPVNSGGSGGFGGSSNGAGSGGSGGSSSGIGSSSGTGGSSSGGPITDAGIDDAAVDCGSIPTLHESPAGDIYCGRVEDGGNLFCLASAGEGLCCLGGALGNNTYAPNTCSPSAAVGCSNGAPDAAGGTAAIPIQCNQVSDCAANGLEAGASCCLQGSGAPTPVPGCGYPKVTGGAQVVCEVDVACGPGEVQICSSNVDCPQGMTCQPGKWKIFQLGFCL